MKIWFEKGLIYYFLINILAIKKIKNLKNKKIKYITFKWNIVKNN